MPSTANNKPKLLTGGGAPIPDSAIEYIEYGNILNLALAVKDDNDEYMVVAAWLETHDNVIRELLRCRLPQISPTYITFAFISNLSFI